MATNEEYLKSPVPGSFNESKNNGDVSQSLSPSDITNLLHGGVAAAKSGEKELARSLFMKVAALDSNNESAWLWLASVSEQANERMEYLQKVLSLNPSNERALAWLKVSKDHLAKSFVQKGADAAKEGDKASAVQYLLQAIDYDSENEIAWMWLASLAGSLEDKLAYLQRILNINPNNEQVREMFVATNRQLARTLAQKGIEAAQSDDKDTANNILQDVLDYETDIEEVWLLKGYVAESLEEKELHFKRVVEINPENQLGVSLLKTVQEQIEEKNSWRCPVCQAKEKKPLDICRVCNSVLTLNEIDFALANDSVNEVLVREGVHNLKRSFKDNITAQDYYKLGLAYLNLKDLKESIAFFQASLRLDSSDEALASRIEYLVQYQENLKAKQQQEEAQAKAQEQLQLQMQLQAQEHEQLQAAVPVVTEESLIEEEANIPAPDFDEKGFEFSEVESPEEFNPYLPTAEFNQMISQSLLSKAEEAFEEKVDDVEDVEVEDASETNSQEIAEAVEEQVAETEVKDENQIEETATTAEVSENEETLGWPMPEAEYVSENVSDMTFVQGEKELEKADTSPLEMPESLREQVELAFGEFPPAIEEPQFFTQEEPQTFTTEETQDEMSAVEEVAVSSTVEEESAVSFNESLNEEPKEMVSFSFNEDVVSEGMFFETSTVEPQEEEEVAAVSSSVEEESAFPATVFEESVSFSTVEEALASLSFEEAAQEEEVEQLTEAETQSHIHSQVEEPVNQTSTIEDVEKLELEAFNIEMPEGHEAEEVPVAESSEELSDVKDSSPAEVSEVENSSTAEVSEVVDSPAQSFAPLANYEIRVMQSPAVNTSVVEMTNVNTVTQSTPVITETVLPEPPAHSARENKVVMIVDDSPTVRKLVSMKLGKSGHRVIAAVDGIDALAKITEEVPDLILLDVTMPRLDGYQLCKLIKNNETTKHVPVIMLSGNEGLVDKVRGKMAGATTFLMKPFEPDVLLKTVNTYCGLHNAN